MDTELPLLLTKLELPPLRAHTLRRPHLLALLRAAPEARLALVSAPAGFGKTTLLASWCHSVAEEGAAATAWVALDEGDNDPARFLAYLMAAVARALGRQEGDPVAPPGAGLRTEVVLTRLINLIVGTGRPCLIVLDDYHLISAPAVHSAVAFLLGHLPDGSCLAIGGRSDPPLPLARLHVRNQLIELRAAELRFSADEVRAFLAMVGVASLPPDEVDAIIALVEGWPAGAQLMALALRSGASLQAGPARAQPRPVERSHHLFAYLADEVFDRQPAQTRRFLLRTAILERMCGPLCAAVVGPDQVPDATAMLSELDHASLFVVPIDAERRWYRYHHLFRSFLINRLALEEPGLPPTLHQRAGDWCMRNGLPGDALEHAFAADDSERAVALIERLALPLIERGEYATLRRWLAQTPAAARASHPSLDLWEAWAALLSGGVEQVGPALARASQAWEARGDRASLAAAAHLRTHLARLAGDAEASIGAARQALADLPAAEVTLRAGSMFGLGAGQLLAGDLAGAEATLAEALEHCTAHNLLGALATRTTLGDLAMRRGRLAEAEAHYEQVLSDCGERAHWERWVASGRLGEIARERNHLDDAAELLRSALEAAERAGVALYLIPAAIAYARTLHALGDGEAAQQVLERALQHARRLGSGPYLRLVRAHLARLALAGGQLSPRWEPEGSLDGDGPLGDAASAVELFTLARLQIAHARAGTGGDRLSGMAATLAALYRLAIDRGHVAIAVEAALLVGIASSASGQPGEAQRWAGQALDLAEPAGYLRLFLDEGQPVATLLERMQDAGGRMKGLAQRVLAAFPTHAARSMPMPLHPSSFTLHPLMIEPLSERETDVLQLVARGASNQDIAEQLVISIGTVKSHLNHILGKLEARNRTEAVARARALGVLA